MSICSSERMLSMMSEIPNEGFITFSWILVGINLSSNYLYIVFFR